MKSLIIGVLIFLDIIPHGIPFVSDWQKELENRVRVEEKQTGFWTDSGQARTGQNDAPKNEPFNFSPLPNKTNEFYVPTVGASEYLAVDLGTGEILLEKDKDKPAQIASLTKLMTARLLFKDRNLAKAVTVNDLSK